MHRDIKPTSVLVTLYDGKPVPKVIDLVQVSHILGSVGSISREKKVRLPGSVW